MFDINYSWDCRPSRGVRRPLWMPSDRATLMWSRPAVWPSGTSSLRSYSPTSVDMSANRSPCWQTLLRTYKGMGPHSSGILIVYWVKLVLSFILNVKRNVSSDFSCKPSAIYSMMTVFDPSTFSLLISLRCQIHTELAKCERTRSKSRWPWSILWRSVVPQLMSKSEVPAMVCCSLMYVASEFSLYCTCMKTTMPLGDPVP